MNPTLPKLIEVRVTDDPAMNAIRVTVLFPTTGFTWVADPTTGDLAVKEHRNATAYRSTFVACELLDGAANPTRSFSWRLTGS